MKLLRLAVLGLRARWPRYLAVCLSLACAFALFVVAMVAQPQTTAAGGESAKRRMVTVNRINFTHPLPLAYVERIGRIDGVERVTHATWMGLYHPEPKNELVAFAVDHRTYFEVYAHLDIAPDALAAFRQRRDCILAGKDLAGRLALPTGSALKMKSNIYSRDDDGWEFTLCGTFTVRTKDGSTDYLLARHDYFDALRPFKNRTVGQIVFLTHRQADNDRVALAIDEAFEHSDAQTVTESVATHNRAQAERVGGMGRLAWWAAWACFAVALAASCSCFLLDLQSRLHELAVLKVAGLSGPRLIGYTAAGPAVVVTLAAMLGTGLAAIAVRWLAASGVDELKVAEFQHTIVWAIGALAAGAVAMSASAALHIALATNPVRALRRGL